MPDWQDATQSTGPSRQRLLRALLLALHSVAVAYLTSSPVFGRNFTKMGF
jgi:hypothetical protein